MRKLKSPTRNEKDFEHSAIEAGYTILRNGWPDYLLLKGEEVIFVETKTPHPRGKPLLSLDQRLMLGALQQLGLTVRIALDNNVNNLRSLEEFLTEPKL